MEVFCFSLWHKRDKEWIHFKIIQDNFKIWVEIIPWAGQLTFEQSNTLDPKKRTTKYAFNDKELIGLITTIASDIRALGCKLSL